MNRSAIVKRGAGYLLTACAIVVLTTGLVVAQDAAPVAVEPSELAKRPDLIGKLISVDDRVSSFDFDPVSRTFDRISLKRCPGVTFRLPQPMRYTKRPPALAAVVRGVLRKDAAGLGCDVSSVELWGADLERLNRATAVLSKLDYENRAAWARWGERRAIAFKDEELLKRSRALDVSAIHAESERPTRDPVGKALELAERARDHSLPEPEPSALAHKALRGMTASAKSVEQLGALLAKVETLLPDAKRPMPDDPEGLKAWQRAYDLDAAEGYRAAPGSTRRVFDRRLWVDVEQALLQRQLVEQPGSELALAETAAEKLPDRPGVATGFLEKGLSQVEKGVGTLRQGEVESAARMIEERLKQPDRAKALFRAWLDDQRDRRLSPRDVEGRVALAQQYEKYVGGRAEAVALLRSAWAIDPQSGEVSEGFLRRGFRKTGGEWVDPAEKGAKPVAVANSAAPGERGRGPAADRDGGTPSQAENNRAADRNPLDDPLAARARADTLLNFTPEQIRAQLGEPNGKSWSFSQGQVIEQWVYELPGKSQYLNFLHRAGERRSRVVSRYSLNRSVLEVQPSP